MQVIDFETDFAKLLAAASTTRDRLLLSAQYDLGLRVGQALGLRHGDLNPMRRQVVICRRDDNANGALSKQKTQFIVDAPRRFFDLYAAYLLGEIARGAAGIGQWQCFGHHGAECLGRDGGTRRPVLVQRGLGHIGLGGDALHGHRLVAFGFE